MYDSCYENPFDNNEAPKPGPAPNTPKKNDGQVEDEEPDRKNAETSMQRKIILRLTRDGKLSSQDIPDPAIGLNPPKAP